jgi:RNA polymerase sigma factor (sigma-70 family)
MKVIRKDIDAEIVDNLCNGQRIDEAIKTIYHNHFGILSYYILQNSGTLQDAEDIFQEVVVSFIELVQKGKFRGESSIKTLLYSINHHTWLNELKKRDRATKREEKYETEQEKVGMDISQLIANREEKAAVATLVSSLGETCRKILQLFYYENCSISEILKVTDYENEQVVRNKKYKCLKQLEQMLNEKPYLYKALQN